MWISETLAEFILLGTGIEREKNVENNFEVLKSYFPHISL